MTRLFLFPALLLTAVALRAQGAAYVVDNARAQVEVIDLGSRQVRATLPTGLESSELLIMPNNRFAFVSNQGENTISLLDLQTSSRAATIPTGQVPGSMSVTPNGRFLYVANEGSNDVTVIDTSSGQRLATIAVDTTPVHVNVSADGRFVYVVNQDETPTGTVTIIDSVRNQVVKRLVVGVRPSQFAIVPGQSTAYVVNGGSNTLSVVSLTTNDVVQSIPVGRGPSQIVFSPDGRRGYVLNRDANSITVIDAQRAAVLTQIAVGTQPADMAITSDSLFAYVSNAGSNNVSVIDLSSNTVEDTIQVGTQPFSVRLDPNEDFVYVTNVRSGTVTVIDANSDAVRATIAVGGAPVDLEFLNAPSLFEISPNPGPAGIQITLRGEGFVPLSIIHFVTSAPPRDLLPAAAFVDGETLRMTVPGFNGPSATVSVTNPDGAGSEQVTFRLGPPVVSILSGGVVEGAGFQKAPYPISGGEIVAVFGNFPGVTQQEASGFPLPGTLGGASVTFNGTPAPLLFVSPTQINLVAPVRLFSTDSAQVAVTVNGQTSPPETVRVSIAAPGIFMISADADGAFLHGADLSLVTAAKPAKRGETIVLFVTGLGDTVPAPVDGQPAPTDVLAGVRLNPAVTVNGAAATVRFAGLAPGYAGLYQINFDVPAAAGSRTASVVVNSGALASNAVRLALEP